MVLLEIAAQFVAGVAFGAFVGYWTYQAVQDLAIHQRMAKLEAAYRRLTMKMYSVEGVEAAAQAREQEEIEEQQAQEAVSELKAKVLEVANSKETPLEQRATQILAFIEQYPEESKLLAKEFGIPAKYLKMGQAIMPFLVQHLAAMDKKTPDEKDKKDDALLFK